MFRQVSVISRQRCCAPKRNRTLVIVLTNIALNTITNPVGDFLIQSLKPSSGITNLEQNSIWCTSSLSYLEALFREHSVRWGRRYHCMPDLQFTSLDSTASQHTNTSTFSFWVNPVLLSWRQAVK